MSNKHDFKIGDKVYDYNHKLLGTVVMIEEFIDDEGFDYESEKPTYRYLHIITYIDNKGNKKDIFAHKVLNENED